MVISCLTGDYIVMVKRFSLCSLDILNWRIAVNSWRDLVLKFLKSGIDLAALFSIVVSCKLLKSLFSWI